MFGLSRLLLFTLFAYFLATTVTNVNCATQRDALLSPEEIRFLLIQKLLEGTPQQNAQRPPQVKKRTCYINAGLSHGCDYKDLVGALAETNYWDSIHSPGRRRKRSFQQPEQQQVDRDNFSKEQRTFYPLPVGA